MFMPPRGHGSMKSANQVSPSPRGRVRSASLSTERCFLIRGVRTAVHHSNGS